MATIIYTGGTTTTGVQPPQAVSELRNKPQPQKIKDVKNG